MKNFTLVRFSNFENSPDTIIETLQIFFRFDAAGARARRRQPSPTLLVLCLNCNGNRGIPNTGLNSITDNTSASCACHSAAVLSNFDSLPHGPSLAVKRSGGSVLSGLFKSGGNPLRHPTLSHQMLVRAVCTWLEGAIENTSVSLIGEHYLSTSLVTMSQLSNFVVKTLSTHSNFVLNSLEGNNALTVDELHFPNYKLPYDLFTFYGIPLPLEFTVNIGVKFVSDRKFRGLKQTVPRQI
ncbi:hypothetical protein YC2023_001058 [Brassica napus]